MEIFKSRYYLYQTLGKSHSTLLGASKDGDTYLHPNDAFHALVAKHFDKKNYDKLTELYVRNDYGLNFGFCEYKGGGFRNLTLAKSTIDDIIKKREHEAATTKQNSTT